MRFLHMNASTAYSIMAAGKGRVLLASSCSAASPVTATQLVRLVILCTLHIEAEVAKVLKLKQPGNLMTTYSVHTYTHTSRNPH